MVRRRSVRPSGQSSDGKNLAANHACCTLQNAVRINETTIISDFDQSYVVTCLPPSYEPGTLVDGRAGFEAIFESRAGFSHFTGSDIDLLKQMVETLARLPDP